MKQAESGRPADQQPWLGHLAGMKGIACLLVMAGHYAGIYLHAQAFVPPIPVIDRLSRFSASLFDEGYWLYLFFVVSGYLVAKSRVETGRDLLVRCVSRFLRLALPVLFSCGVIWLIDRTVGFHAADTAPLFQSAWLQNCYTEACSLKDVLLSPFTVLLLGESRLNAPYWVLRSMLLSSLLIYLLKYLCARLKASGHEALTFSALALITLGAYALDPIITACLAGMMLSLYENSGIWKTPCFAIWALILVRAVYLIPLVVRPVLFFSALVLLIPRVPPLNRLFSSKPFQFLGRMSWGIYSFHWPLTCSAGALAMLGLAARTGLKAAYGLAFLLVLLLTLVLSFCFYHTFERLAAACTRKVSRLLQRALKVPDPS